MRSHDQAEVRERCEAAVPDVFRAHGLPEPKWVRADDEGWVNACYFVDDRYVVRFNARDTDIPKFARETVAYGLLRDTGVPVPDVAVLDESREHAPYDVLITTLLPGRSIERSWKYMSEAERARVSAEAAALLVELHGVSFDAFGEISRGAPDRAAWIDVVNAVISERLNKARSHEMLTAAEAARIKALFDRGAPLFADIDHASLVHGDYHFGNLLTDGERITGVVDFEWALSGDPEMDLCLMAEQEGFLPGSRAHFEPAYRALSPADHRTDRRRSFYRCLRNVELCEAAAMHLSDAERAEYREETLKQLDVLERRLNG